MRAFLQGYPALATNEKFCMNYLLQKYFLGFPFLSFPDNMILLVDIWNWYSSLLLKCAA